MQCNCLEVLVEKVKETKAYEEVSIREDSLYHPLFEDRIDTITATQVEVRLPGKKKTKIVKIGHGFCPFCGEKTLPEDAKSNEGAVEVGD